MSVSSATQCGCAWWCRAWRVRAQQMPPNKLGATHNSENPCRKGRFHSDHRALWRHSRDASQRPVPAKR
jgi:hypothetical protein